METVHAILIMLFIIFFLIFLWVLSIIFFMRRAVKAVINIFREHDALSLEKAKTGEELGIIQRRGIAERMVKSPDYKPHALQFLMKMEVVKERAGSFLYLSENDLASLQQKKSGNEEGGTKIWKLLLPSDI